MKLNILKSVIQRAYALRELKTLLRAGQLIAPYVLTFGITFGGFAALGATPFYRDEHKKELETMKEIDSLGNIRYEQQYDEYTNAYSSISYYTKWNLVENNLYSRNIETYELDNVFDNITEEQMVKLINSDDEFLRNILGKPISTTKETKNNLSEEELQSDPFYQATIYSKSDNDYIIVKETSIENIILTLVWFLLSAYVTGFILPPDYWSLSEHNSCCLKYLKYVEKIKENHPIIDTKELTKKLEIKKSDYNKLTK